MNDLLKFNSLIKRLGGRSLYLVGMMGSGKSRTGPHLAKALQYSFIDQDEIIIAGIDVPRIANWSMELN